MTNDQIVQAIAIGAMLLLVLRGLSTFRVGRLIGMGLTWCMIFVAAILMFANRDALGPVLESVRDRFDTPVPQVVGGTLRVPMSADGHFWVRGKVNGHSVRFLIDSGATTVALSPETVDAADVNIRRDRLPILIGTANGMVRADRVTIGKLDVGPIHAEDLPAVTADGFGEMNVLGMNFLSGLESWGVDKGVMVLRPKSDRQFT